MLQRSDTLPASSTSPGWWQRVLKWLTETTPGDFGYFRSCWSCGLLAELLAWETGVRRSAETIRRGLHREGDVWRRPRPVVGPTDPDYSQKLREIRHLLDQLPPSEVAVFQDEVDVNLNPKIGPMWTPRGQQAAVATPGNNEKRYLAGSLSWQTGRLFVSPPQRRRNADLFLSHLAELQQRLRRYRVIHVLCDNAKFHNCRKVRQALQQRLGRIRLHFLPKYAPETNPIERVWWHLHETITRNHRCETLEELLRQTCSG
ncbi:DDE endonuclease [Planctomycetales bacterium 10988]|nr:DDE endonuclease [Planctomycetales bacterium 10988]